MATWKPKSSAEYVALIRATLDGYLGESLDYDRTVDGAWTLAAANFAAEVDAGILQCASDLSVDSAQREALIAKFRRFGSFERQATRTQVTANKIGTVSIPIGSFVWAQTYYLAPNGETRILPAQQWEVVDNSGGSIANPSLCTLSCVQPGVCWVPDPTTFQLVTPIVNITNVVFDTSLGHTEVRGRNAATTQEIRSRLQLQRFANGGSMPAVRRVLLDISWVRGVSVQSLAGTVTIGIAPGPATVVQQEQLAQAILSVVPAVTLAGADTYTIPVGPDGLPWTAAWNTGTVESVDVAVSGLVAEPGYDAAQLTLAVKQAIDAYFSSLEIGGTARYLRVISACAIPGVLSVTVLVDGATADFSPSTSIDMLTPNFI